MSGGETDPKTPASPSNGGPPGAGASSAGASRPGPSNALAGASAADVAARIAGLASLGTPLPAGLLALADDWPNRRVAARLRELARRIAAGQPLAKTLAALGMPAFERLLAAGMAHGPAARVMEDCLRLELERSRRARELRSALIYPLFLVSAALAWLYCLIIFCKWIILSPSVEYTFGTQVSPLQYIAFWLTSLPWWQSAAIFLAPAAAVAATRLVVGRRNFYWLCGWLPVVGSVLRWRELVAWGFTLHTLIGHRAPLDESLLIAAAGARDAKLARQSRLMAEAVRRGSSLSDCLRGWRRLPPMLVPLVSWGEQSRTLAEAFGVASEYWSDRFNASLRVARSVLPPLAFGFVVLVVGLGLNASVLSFLRALLW